eukprot:2658325-Pyramimonas_sp.AAC.1
MKTTTDCQFSLCATSVPQKDGVVERGQTPRLGGPPPAWALPSARYTLAGGASPSFRWLSQ